MDRLGGLRGQGLQRRDSASRDRAQIGSSAIRRARNLAHHPLLLLPPGPPALRRTIAENKSLNIPVEITRWLGRKSFEEGDFSAAEQYLLPVAKDSKNVDPEVLIELAEAEIQLGKTREAAPIVAQYLETAREPQGRARGLQAQAAVSLGQKDFDEAAKLCDESLLLQPEGRLNAEGRLLSGEISFARGDYDGAARAFMTVAVLYDDSSVTPRALRRAADAYRKANNEQEAEKALQELQQRFPDFIKSPKSPRSIDEASPSYPLYGRERLGRSKPPSKNRPCPQSTRKSLFQKAGLRKRSPRTV